jgi:DNA modification methylase
MDLLADGRDVLIEGDCLEVAQRVVPPGTLAFVYTDPPFGTGRAQNYRLGMEACEAPFQDRGDPAAWLRYWTPRLDAMTIALRPGGILVVHLDPRRAPHVRLLLDERLGASNFLNEIVWHYRSGGVARDRLAAKHDTLLVYRTAQGHTFNRTTEKRYLAHRANRPGVVEHRDARGWFRYARLDDVWEIPFLPADSRERLGYPTQKPEALIVRLLEVFTQRGDSIADFTCGSGTVAAAASRLDRHWLASDIDPRAVACAAGRIARLRSPALSAAWDSGGIAGRRHDLKERLHRMRENGSTWGLTDEESSAAEIRIIKMPAQPLAAKGRTGKGGDSPHLLDNGAS